MYIKIFIEWIRKSIRKWYYFYIEVIDIKQNSTHEIEELKDKLNSTLNELNRYKNDEKENHNIQV